MMSRNGDWPRCTFSAVSSVSSNTASVVAFSNRPMTMLSRSVRAAVWRARQTAEAATPAATTAAAAAIRTASRRFDGPAGLCAPVSRGRPDCA